MYYRCLSWMGGDRNDVEDALSLASLKAWKKLPKYADKITNLRAWLTRLTHNLCVDIHRGRYSSKMTSIEEIAGGENEVLISNFESPESAILRHELKLYVRHAVNALCERLRHPFVLHFFEKISYKCIAKQLNISVDNVYKRIQQAREVLQKHLSMYLSGRDDFAFDFSNKSSENVSHGSEESVFDEKMLLEAKEAIAMESVGETISYHVSATCLETILPSFYHSPNLLG